MNVSLYTVTLLLLAATGGGIIMSVCGFGFGAVAMSILPYFLPYQSAVALSSFSSFCTSVMISFKNRQHIRWRVLAPCGLMGIVASFCSVLLTVNVKGTIMMRALGILLIAVAVYSTFLGGRIHIRPTVLNGAIAGGLGGTLAGLFSVGGPPVAIYMLACTDNDNNAYRATICTHFCCTAGFSTLSRWTQGIVTMETVHMLLIMLGGLVLGIFLGDRIFKKLNPHRLRMAVYGYLALSGLMMIFK